MMKVASFQCPTVAFARPTTIRRARTSPVCAAEESRRDAPVPRQLTDASLWPQQRAANSAPRRSVLDLVSGLVEINDNVQRFETIAGRSAMIGFVVACVAELAAPSQGFFGAWTQSDLSAFSALALSLICSAGLLATQNKRQIGFQFREAVQASLTALRGSMAGVQGKEVDSAVDFVFDTVFDRDFVADYIIEDEYI